MHVIDFLYYASMLLVIIHIMIHDMRWMMIENHMLLLMVIIHIMFISYQDAFHFDAVIESSIIFIFLICLRWFMNTRYKKDTLGFGDIKLLTLITFMMSLETITYVIFFASLITLVVMLMLNRHKVPFAPGILLSWIGVYVWLYI